MGDEGCSGATRSGDIQRRRRVAFPILLIAGLAARFSFPREVPAAKRPEAWRDFAIAAAGGALLGAVLTAVERRIAGTPAAGLIGTPAFVIGASAVAAVIVAVTSRTFGARASMALEGACTGGSRRARRRRAAPREPAARPRLRR